MSGMQCGHYSLNWGNYQAPNICDSCGKEAELVDFGDCKKYVCWECETSWRV